MTRCSGAARAASYPPNVSREMLYPNVELKSWLRKRLELCQITIYAIMNNSLTSITIHKEETEPSSSNANTLHV